MRIRFIKFRRTKTRKIPIRRFYRDIAGTSFRSKSKARRSSKLFGRWGY